MNQSEYRKEFLGRYHHTITKTPDGGIVILGGRFVLVLLFLYFFRNMDHTLCLFVEEGEERDKSVSTSKNVDQITVSNLVPNELVPGWIEYIYNGKFSFFSVFTLKQGLHQKIYQHLQKTSGTPFFPSILV